MEKNNDIKVEKLKIDDVNEKINKIKLSLYLKRNTPYIFRNVFLSVVNDNEDINMAINKNIIHIKEGVYNQELEADILMSDALDRLRWYIERNIFNYSEVKKVFKYDIQNTIPKPKLKEYLFKIVRNNYYIDCILNST